MDEELFRKQAIMHVSNLIKETLEPNNRVQWAVYVVWQVKVLQNNKALLASTLPDGKYFEVTFNGDDKMFYVDEYVKTLNKQIKYI